MIGITGYGAYIPRLRLERKAAASAHAWLLPGLMGRAKGERAMANWDEDAITMAVEAGRDVLGPNDDRSYVDTLYLATTTSPFSDRLGAGIVASALTLEPGIAAADVTSCQKASLTALRQALQAVKSGASKTSLVCASDRRKTKAASNQELDYGDGAAAVTIGGEGVGAEFLGAGSQTADFIDHFRGANEEFDYNWEERWIRDEGLAKLVPPALEAALDDAGISASDVTHFVFPCLFRGVPQKLAKSVGINPDSVVDNLQANCGETGTAHALMMLNAILETAKKGDVILVAQFGQGCEALIFKVTGETYAHTPQRGVSGVLESGRTESNYMKFAVFNNLIEWDRGMRAEKDNKTALTTLYRNRDMLLGLVGGKCTETGTVQFPASRISVSPNSPTVDTQEPYKFADRKASILSWSADHLTYSMAPPNHYGMIVFEEGGRIMMDITDVEAGEVDSGQNVKMVFRVKDWDDKRGFTRYFWKAAPA